MNLSSEILRHNPKQTAGPLWSVLATQEQLLYCPMPHCGGVLFPSPGTFNCDPATGLSEWVCRTCWHQGKTSLRGLRVLDTDGQKYVFSYGPSSLTLAVLLSARSCSGFRRYKMSPAQIATYIAEWTLLTGRAEGTLDTSSETIAMVDCREYFEKCIVPNR